MQKTISVMEILSILRKKWGVLFISTLLGATVLVLVSVFMMPKIYTSSISLYVNNSVSSSDNNVNINDLNASTRLVDTYIVILTNEDILEQAAQRIGESVTASDLKNAITMNSVNQTEVLQISAGTTDPELSAQICNTMADLAPEVLQRVVKAGSVEDHRHRPARHLPFFSQCALECGDGRRGRIGFVSYYMPAGISPGYPHQR